MAKQVLLKVSVASSIFLTFFVIASLSYIVLNFYITGFVIFNNLLNLLGLITLAIFNVLILILTMLSLTPKSASWSNFKRLRTLSNLIILLMVVSLAILSFQIVNLTPEDLTANLGFLIFVNVLSLVGPFELFIEVEVLKMTLTDTGVLPASKRS